MDRDVRLGGPVPESRVREWTQVDPWREKGSPAVAVEREHRLPSTADEVGRTVRAVIGEPVSVLARCSVNARWCRDCPAVRR